MGNIIASLATWQKKEPSGSSGGLTAADNGLSVAIDGVTVVLGEDVTNPQSGISKLLNARYIPMNNFPLLFGLTNHPDPSLNDNFVIDPGLGVYINYLDSNGHYPYFALSQQDLTLPYVYWQRDPADPIGFVYRWSGGGVQGNALKFWDTGNLSLDVFPTAADDGIGAWQVHGSQTLYSTPSPTNDTAILGIDLTNRQIVQAMDSNSTSLPGNGVTTTFTVAHALGVTPNQVVTQGTNTLGASLHFINNKTAASFDVVFLAAPAAAATIDWIAKK